MSEHVPVGRPQDVATWFGEGPDRAPADLLARSMARIATTRQRPAPVAVALGAPALGEATSRQLWMRTWAVAALLVLAAVVAVVVVGSWRQRPLLTVVPTPDPTTIPLDVTPIPTEAAPIEHPAFDAGQNVFVTWSPVNPWTDVVAIPGGNPSFVAEHLREVAFDTCVNLCSGRFVIDLIVGTIDEGLVYGWQACPTSIDGLQCAVYQAEHPAGIMLAIEGRTTDELAAAWQAEFGAAIEQAWKVVNDDRWRILTYEDRSVAIVAKGSRAVAVTVKAQGGLPADAVPVMLERFLPAIWFGADPNPGLLPPVTADLGDLTLTMPGNFSMTVSARSIQLNEDGGAGNFLVIDQRVTRLAPGEPLRIEYRGGSATTLITVSGRTLDDLKRSIDEGLASAVATDLRLGDARGYRWRVAQASIVHPLVAVAVIEWKGSFYVFEEHFPLDGPAGGNFELLLQGVTLR